MSVRIAFIGDTLLGGEAENTFRRKGYGHALKPLEPILRRADFAIANHEGAVTSRANPLHKATTGDQRRWWYRADPSSLAALRASGVTHLSLANNHAMDYGPDGLEETLRAAEAADIEVFGAGCDERHARCPLVIESGGLRLGLVSRMQHYNISETDGVYAGPDRPGVALLHEAHLREDFDSAAPLDLRIALVHWGMNYQPVTAYQRRSARALRRAGVDLIVGHHAHIAQKVAIEENVPVLYGLGNGAYGALGRFEAQRAPACGLIAIVEINKHAQIRKLELHLIRVDNRRTDFRLEVARGEAAQVFLKTLVDDAEVWRCPDGASLHRVFARPNSMHSLSTRQSSAFSLGTLE